MVEGQAEINTDVSVENAMRLMFEASQVFTPSAPIDQQNLFAGRAEQRIQIVETVAQRGQHAVVYGERGLGKTSLVNMLGPWLESIGKRVIAPRVNCDGSDSFTKVWRKMFSEIRLSREAKKLGFGPLDATVNKKMVTLADDLPKNASPDDIRTILTPLGHDSILVLIFDEFDRLQNHGIKQMFADTIKTLSDHSVRATTVLVGVADTIDGLIAEHRSIERAIVQIQIKRMTPPELKEIIDNGLSHLGMTIEDNSRTAITSLSQGLPHYTHSLGLHASRQALDDRKLRIGMAHVGAAIRKAVDLADHSIRDSYQSGIRSARRDNLYADVILSCALAEKDDFGSFSAASVRDSLNRITGKEYKIASFSQHLNNLCEPTHGAVLHKSGEKRRFRFRFTNPLMQPFVVMRGYSDGKLNAAKLGFSD